MNSERAGSQLVQQRILIRGLLRGEGPIHAGGGPDDLAWRQIARDINGIPYIPGASLAAAFRREIASAFSPQSAARLFGPASAGQSGQPLLAVDHAPLVNHAGITEIHYGIAAPAVSEPGAVRFLDGVEILPSGSQFRMSLELLQTGESAREDLTAALHLLRCLESPEGLAVGSRRSRGWGRLRGITDETGYRWTIRMFSMTSAHQLLAWLAFGSEYELPDSWPQTVLQGYLRAADMAKRLGCQLPAPAAAPLLTVRVRLMVGGSLLIRAPAAGAADAAPLDRTTFDARSVPLRQYVIPGTALAGALRRQCQRIVHSLAGSPSVAAEQVIGSMFGDRSQESLLRVPDAPVTGAKVLRNARMRMDPWTGSAHQAPCVLEDALYGGEVEFTLTLKPPCSEREAATPGLTDAHRALLLLALRDLAQGRLVIGSGGGSGRGWFKPGPDGVIAEIHGPISAVYRQQAEGPAVIEPEGAVSDLIPNLRRALGIGGAQ